MPNDTSNLLMTVLGAAAGADMVLQYKNAFIDRIHWDVRPRVSQTFQTVRIIVPTINQGEIVDIGNGPIQPTDLTKFTKDITINHKFSGSYVIKGFDQALIGIDLQNTFFMPKFETMLRTVNQSIVNLLTTTNFGTGTTPAGYTLFTGNGTVANQLTRADIATAWTALANTGVPLDNANDISLMVNANTYGQFLADNQFTQALYVGDTAAIGAQQRAQLTPMLGVTPFFDQQLTLFNAGHAPAVMLHRYAIAGVTASEPAPIAGAPFAEAYYRLRGLPIRVQIGQSLVDQGVIVHFSLLCGFAVIRPEMAILFQTAS
jgi:hypothetical protein